jgi:ElaA protein
MTFTVRVAPLREVEPATLYAILALRVDVFVVEQHCAYRELDGRDLEPSARLVWVETDGLPIATLRLLIDPDDSARIGRVATAPGARSQGVAAAIMTKALELCAGRQVVLDAQVQLRGWYERFGFAPVGADFEEDGIVHVQMRRPAHS